jgi:4a-hydroxytetrahydrobiopterin dehydratase
MTNFKDLEKRKCVPCEGGIESLKKDEAEKFLSKLDKDWKITDDYKKIYKEFKTKNHYEIISIVNMIAWISHTEDHHPEITFHYNAAKITYYTYAINGLSENDFICAAKIDYFIKI